MYFYGPKDSLKISYVEFQCQNLVKKSQIGNCENLHHTFNFAGNKLNCIIDRPQGIKV